MGSDSNYELESDENDNKTAESDNDFLQDQKKKYTCTFPGCKATFPRPSRLQRHINVHTNERPYKCTQKGCDRAYTNSSHLKRHLETHNIINKSFQCQFCKASMSTMSNLKRHFKRAHNTNREMYCTQCTTWFAKKNRFEEHMKMHENSSTFKCDKCGKSFKTHLLLTKHQKRHEQKKTYQCPVKNCTQVFDKWMSMLTHKRTEHTAEYSCYVCDKNFASRSHLKAHSKVHSQDRPTIACPYDKCCRLYYYRRNLDVHIRTKHKSKKFTCDICQLELSSKQKVEDHIVKLHLTEQQKPAKRKAQSTRKDAGIPKVPIISMLTGIQFGVKANVELRNRKSEALLRDQLVEESYSSYSEDDNIRIKGA